MDPEQVKKRQTLRVLFSEAMMVVSVIIIMTVLIMITSGYWINQNFEVERQGMLQIFSSPTGATIEVDGETGWLVKTNNSKIVSSGEHEVKISKDGYDSWTKKVAVKEGLMYRIPYVRLFPLEREAEKINEISALKNSVSADFSSMLLIDDSTTWKLLKLSEDNVKTTSIGVGGVLSGENLAERITDISWSKNANKVLMKVADELGGDWVLIDLKNIEKSLNLTKTFGVDFDDVKIFDQSGDFLLAVNDGDLRRLDVGAQTMSKVLAEHVLDFNMYNNSVVYVSRGGEGQNSISILKDVDSKPVTIMSTNSENAFAAIGRFYDNDFLVVVDGQTLAFYEGQLSRADHNSFEQKYSAEISFVPEKIKVDTGGVFFVMRSGRMVAALDMESGDMSEYDVEGDKIGWIDDYMIYTVNDEGSLIVYDFDGLNRRELSKNASSRFDAAIFEDKWLYYFSDGWLVRENLQAK